MTKYNVQDRIVTYKDPNYGNTEIKITYRQFQKMGGEHEIKIRPFIARGEKPSRLGEITD